MTGRRAISVVFFFTVSTVLMGQELPYHTWIPHIASSAEWRTDLIVDHLGDDGQEIYVDLYDQGELVDQIQIDVKPHQQLVLPLANATCGLVRSQSPDLVLRTAFQSVSEGGLAEFVLDRSASAFLNFTLPDGTLTDLDWSGLAFMNTHTAAAEVALVARAANGQAIAGVTRTLAAFSRDVFELNQVFTDVDFRQIARIEASSSVPLSGLVLTGLQSNRILLFTKAIGRVPAGQYPIPHIAQDSDQWSTYLHLDNTRSEPLSALIKLHAKGQLVSEFTLDIAAESSLSLPLGGADVTLNAETGMLESERDGLIVRLSYHAVKEGGAAEFTLQPQMTQNVAFCLPNYADTLTWMGFALFNSGSEMAQTEWLAYESGQLVESQLLSIPPLQRLSMSIDTLFENNAYDQILVRSSAQVSGIDLSGNGNQQLLFSPVIQQTPPSDGVAVDGLYFPGDTATWETQAPAQVGWDQDALARALDFAGENRSSGVVVAVAGRIIGERYWEPQATNRLGQSESGLPMEDVASVQKSVTSLLATMARDRGLLDLERAVSEYIGEGWSQASAADEGRITVRHLLSMTSGLNDQFEYRFPAGVHWQYNTPVYATLHPVLEAATGLSLNLLTSRWLTIPLAMKESFWNPRGEGASNANGFVTHARDLARAGLVMLAQGSWAGEELIANKQLLWESVQPSQPMNSEYGFLWWLNAEGTLIPTAPVDLIAAQGASGRRIYVVPSMDLVVTRTGNNPSGSFYREFWALLMAAANYP